MVDAVLVLLLVVAILLVADFLLAGGAMTMGGMTAMAGVVAHPLVAGALAVLVVALAVVLGVHF